MEQTVFTRELVIARFGERAVRRDLEAQRWQSFGLVVVTHNGPLTYAERLTVGLKAVKPGRAAVDRLSALASVSDLAPPPKPQIALAVGIHAPDLEGVDYSWARDLESKTVKVAGVLTLQPAHALLRANGELTTIRDARTLVSRALQRKAVSAGAIRTALGPTPRWRHSALVAEVVTDFEGGIQSVTEKEFDQLIAQSALPMPTRQRRVRGADGRYYLDASWDDYRLGAEVHGWQHWEFAQREADNWRTADIVAGGRRLIPFSSWAVRHEPERVSAVLERALMAGGWRR